MSKEKTALVRRDRLVFFAGVAIIVVMILVTIEIAAFFSTTYLAKRYGIVFYLPQITEDYATYASRVNTHLGWPSPQAIQKEREKLAITKAAVHKPERAFPISAYGDSFTAGYGVAPEDVWSNVLGKMLDCRIANYGVAGYGTDQAYLRFHENTQDEAKIVLLGVLSENIQRNVNQLRNLLVPDDQCQTKPRFVLDKKGKLRLVPLPPLTAENYEDFIQNPDHYLKHDYFVPGGPSGAQKAEFPYTWSMLKAWRFFYTGGYKSYLQFYRLDHPSRAFPLTMAIIKQFFQEARNRGKHPILLIFPTNADFRYYNQNHSFVYQLLIDELEKEHIEYVDLGSELIKRLGGRDYMEIFHGQRYFHYNKEGNRLVAQIMYDYFTGNNYCPQTHKQTLSTWKTQK
jgi:hypothetical protein